MATATTAIGVPMHVCHGLARLVLCVASAQACATPVVYDEALAGDLPGGPYAQATSFRLDAGTNLIRGTMGVMPDEPYFEFDDFRVVIPEGLELVGARVRADNAQGAVQAVMWLIPRSSAIEALALLVEAATTLDFTNELLAEPDYMDAFGGYQVQMRGYGGDASSNRPPGFADWQFTFELRALPGSVPEPGTAALAVSALVVAALRARSRRRRPVPHSACF